MHANNKNTNKNTNILTNHRENTKKIQVAVFV